MSSISYAPTQLKVVSLGIGISDETNSNLNIKSNQSLIVGERIQSVSNSADRKTYGLIVDNEGIAINTSMESRASVDNNYAAYVEGNVRITGNMFLDGTITTANSLGGGAGAGENY